MAGNRELLALLAVLCAVIGWSWVNPYDRLTWWLESIPALVGILILGWTRRSFPLTRLLYWLIFAHALVLVVGGHYTYARVPLGFWLQDVFDFARNPYDRIGHIAQGFVPALIARELLLRKGVIEAGGWLFFVVTCIALALSAFYEIIEWWSAVVGGDGSVEFLGTQGDVWDAQWDMVTALVAAIAAQLLLARWHDSQIALLANASGERSNRESRLG